MRIVNLELLNACSEKHNDSKEALKTWLSLAKSASWKTPVDIKNRFSSASFLPGNRVVFNISGNHYRIVTVVNYPFSIVEIRFVGNHAEYDRINAEKI